MTVPTKLSVLMLQILRAALVCLDTFMNLRAGAPWLGTVGMVAFGAGVMATQSRAATRWPRLLKWGTGAAWLCGVAVPAGLVLSFEVSPSLEQFVNHVFAVAAWAITS